MASFPFAVVMTLSAPSPSAKKLRLLTSPTTWLTSDNVLSFPTGMNAAVATAYVKLGRYAMKPAPEWPKFAYILRERFKSFDDAEGYVDEHDMSDSDREEDCIDRLRKIQRHIDGEGMIYPFAYFPIHFFSYNSINCRRTARVERSGIFGCIENERNGRCADG